MQCLDLNTGNHRISSAELPRSLQGMCSVRKLLVWKTFYESRMCSKRRERPYIILKLSCISKPSEGEANLLITAKESKIGGKHGNGLCVSGARKEYRAEWERTYSF